MHDEEEKNVVRILKYIHALSQHSAVHKRKLQLRHKLT